MAQEGRRKNVTASESDTKFIEISHLFKISGYSLPLENNPFALIQSTSFELGGHWWAINFYPQYHHGYTSVFIVLRSKATKVLAKIQFHLRNQSGNFVTINPDDEDAVFMFAGKGIEMGYERFMKTSDMSAYLQDDSFTMKCTLHVLTSSVKQVQLAYRPEEDPSKKCSDLGNLLKRGDGADIVFDVRGNLFRAHKCILAARSEYFRAYFFGSLGKSEADEHIKVDDAEPAVFEAMLRYIYTDSFPDIEEHEDVVGAKHVRILLMQRLIPIADQYLIDHLKSTCECLLRNEIADSNVVTFLALAAKYNCDRLKIACLNRLSNPGSLAIAMLTDEFSHMALACPLVLKEIKDNTSHQMLEKALSELQDSLALLSESST